ncbi:MAG: hypothetical protein KJ976_06460, partial [Proteobacteria bacterium]|nr:hypothetical protein [Pseudomonadota bacterium]
TNKNAVFKNRYNYLSIVLYVVNNYSCAQNLILTPIFFQDIWTAIICWLKPACKKYFNNNLKK